MRTTKKNLRHKTKGVRKEKLENQIAKLQRENEKLRSQLAEEALQHSHTKKSKEKSTPIQELVHKLSNRVHELEHELTLKVSGKE